MANVEHTLKSGSVLKITTAPFEAAIALVEAVKAASFGRSATEEVGDIIVFDPGVRKALGAVFDTVLYDQVRVSAGLFDDLKLGERARGDYVEICAKVIEVNVKPFFLMTSSASKPVVEQPSGSQGSS